MTDGNVFFMLHILQVGDGIIITGNNEDTYNRKNNSLNVEGGYNILSANLAKILSQLL